MVSWLLRWERGEAGAYLTEVTSQPRAHAALHILLPRAELGECENMLIVGQMNPFPYFSLVLLQAFLFSSLESRQQ